MNISEWLQRIMVGFGAAWVMWLMLGLSVDLGRHHPGAGLVLLVAA